MVVHGLYVIKGRYYADFPDPCLMSNKGGRPFYYCVEDKDGLLWMIPISSKVEKYEAAIMAAAKAKGYSSMQAYLKALIEADSGLSMDIKNKPPKE
ncbi:hypothetical protein LJC49_11310 [Ruminococcaceae bacterium OttesenSCG-928-I18]|nr:hypothetical protein [Ruminococcaceae bacterium OttesenSCG-928-I18]